MKDASIPTLTFAMMLRAAVFGMIINAPCFSVASEPVNGTTGVPLGGIGAGAFKFSAYDGKLYRSYKTPTMEDNFALEVGQFQFYSKRGTTVVTKDRLIAALLPNNRHDDDAVYPVHYVNFGVINGCSVKLTAFAPFSTTDANLMTYPIAMYEFEINNPQSDAVEASCALQLTAPASVSLVAGKGFASSGGIEAAVYGTLAAAGAVVSAGSDNGFLTSGVCNNTVGGTTNRVAVKVSVAAGQKQYVRFVNAWYNGATPAWYYYTNNVHSAAEAADFGLAHFDDNRNAAVNFSTRWFNSSLPRWLKNYVVNLLTTHISNVIYTQDGRCAWWEGWNFNITGTLDQSWHSKISMILLAPQLAAKEMEYWARTQKSSPLGQIHHDFGGRTTICAWDDKQHGDYAGIDGWADLNCGFIFNVWEYLCATGDQAKFDYFWPFLKLAGRRIITQTSTMAGPSSYPYTFQGSSCTYDIGGNCDLYNAGLTSAAYKLMQILAQRKNETACADTYRIAFETVNNSFKNRYLSNNLPFTNMEDGPLAGQWMGYFLKLGEFYPTSAIDYGVTQYYNKLGADTNGTKSGNLTWWMPYYIGHYGGILLNAGRPDDWYNTQYYIYRVQVDDRDKIFNQGHAQYGLYSKYPSTSTRADLSYCSVPVSLRNYLSLIGYHRDKMSGELWLEPIVPSQMGHKFTDALYFSPEGMGTVGYEESGAGYLRQDITFKPDNPITVSSLYVNDKGYASPYVYVNRVKYDATKQGTGHLSELKINYSGAVPSSGILVTVSDVPVKAWKTTFAGATMPASVTYSGLMHSLMVTAPEASLVEIFGSNGILMRRARVSAGITGIAMPEGMRGWCVVRLISEKCAEYKRVLVMR